jgi:general secretion pathway protein K
MKIKITNKKQGGFVVIVVLCTVILLTALLLGFNQKSRAKLYIVDSFRKSEHALNCARAGLNIAIAAIKNTDDIYKNTNSINLFSGENIIPVGDGNCTVTIIEENGKLNINHLVAHRTPYSDKTGKLNKTRIDQLLRLIDLLNKNNDNHQISYSLVPSIIDWIDSDDEVTYLPFIKYENSGAESSYYTSLEKPYQPKNKPLNAVEELLMIKGVTPRIFQLIHDYVTVKGDGLVNINFAPKLVIESLSENIDPALAQIIIERRRIKPFESIAELKDVPGMTENIYQAISKSVTIKSSECYNYVTSHGDFERYQHTIAAIVKKNTTTKNVEMIMYKEF